MREAPDESAPRRMLGRASLAGMGTICQQGLAFVTGLVIARLLGSAEYGVINLARNLIDTVSIVTRLGLETGLQRFFGETRGVLQDAARCAVLRRLRVLAACVALVPVLCVAAGLGSVLEHDVYRYTGFAQALLLVSLGLPFMTDLAVLAGAYRGVLKLAPSVIAESLVLPAARLVLVVLFFVAGWGLVGVALGSTVGSALAAVWLARRARSDFPVTARCSRSWREAFHVVGYSGVLAAAVLVTTLMSNMDILVLGHYVNAAELGQYALARSLLLVVGIPALMFNQGLGALVAERWFRGDVPGMRRVLATTFRWVSLASVPLCVILVLEGQRILSLFGASFALPQAVITWLAAGQLCTALLGPMGWALSMTGRHVLELCILTSGLVLAAISCALLIPRFGQLGAAAASCIAAGYVNLARVLCIRQRLGVWPITFAIARQDVVTGQV